MANALHQPSAPSSSKTRILFVDDEPMILEVLQFSLAAMKGAWETRYVDSGDKALRLLQEETFDLVVADMVMPGISGANLLNEVFKRYPATGRIILSGHASRDDVMRCVGATHQFLSKPYDLDLIETTFNRVRSLRERLRAETVQKLVVGRKSLPSVPVVYFDLLDAVQDPTCPLERIAEIIATDLALTAKILQLVNSAFFGYGREVSSANEAVMLLGLSTVRSLALTTHVFAAFEGVQTADWSIEKVWHHSMRVGQRAQRITQLETGDESLAEQALTAGILHDVGKLILADNLRLGYLEVVADAAKTHKPLFQAEQETFEATHADIGACLLDLWGLPVPLVEAVALHHEPSKASQLGFSPLTAVHVADVFENAANAPDSAKVIDQLDCLYLDQLGLGSHIETWKAKSEPHTRSDD